MIIISEAVIAKFFCLLMASGVLAVVMTIYALMLPSNYTSKYDNRFRAAWAVGTVILIWIMFDSQTIKIIP